MFVFLYATGLRLSETLALGVEDVDIKCMVIHVRGSKAGQDRYLPIDSIPATA